MATPVHAGTVAILRPSRPTAALTETLSRLHGELLSVGLEVKLLDPPADRAVSSADSRAWLGEVTAAGEMDAVIDIIGYDAPVYVDVWVIEKSPRRFELSRVPSEPNTANNAERLAIRAIEVLRSSFLESDMLGSKPFPTLKAKPPKSASPQGERNRPTRRTERIGVEVGAAAISSLDGLGPAILPLLRLDWAPRSWLIANAEFAGLGSRPAVATTAGNARIAQQYGVIGGDYRFLSDQGLRPFVGLSVGSLHTSVEGEADVPRQGHYSAHWAFLLEGRVGVALRLKERYYLTLAVLMHMAEPYVAVHIADTVAATSGRPNVGLTLTIGAWL